MSSIQQSDWLVPCAEWLIYEEGFRQYPYRCTANKLTIGIGRNLQDTGITAQEAELLLSEDNKNKRLAGLVLKDEGKILHRPKVVDSDWIIGYGYNLSKFGIPRRIAEIFLQNDINRVYDWMKRYPFWELLDDPRKCAVINMGFQLGPARFAGFRKTIAYLNDKLFTSAAEESQRSSWRRQTPQRAARVAHCIKTGKLPEVANGKV